jgi:peptidyl-prolyl cis-trans isomerase D
MLETIRKHAGSWLVKALFGLLILSFAAWGIGDMLRPASLDRVAITVGNIEIETRVVRDELRLEMQRMQSIMQRPVDAGMAREFGLLERIVEQTVTRALIDSVARELGLAIGDDSLLAAIQADSNFAGIDNRFDPAIFRMSLQRAGYSEVGYLQALRNDKLRQQLLGAIDVGARAPRQVAAALHLHREQRRVAETLYLKNSTLPDPGTAPIEELRAYYNENQNRWLSSELRALTAILILPESLHAEIKISDEEIENEYQSRRAEFEEIEQRTLEQVLLADETAARKVEAAIKEGKSLEDAASANGTEVIALGVVLQTELPLELAGPVFAAAQGAVVGPIASPLGWHLMRASSVIPGRTKPLAEVRDSLRAEMMRREAADVVARMSNRLDDALAAGATLEDVAQKMDFKLLKIDAVSARGGDADGQRRTDLPAWPEFLETAFRQGVREEGQLMQARDGGAFVIRVDEAIPAAPRPFEKVQLDVARVLRGKKLSDAAAARGSQAMARILAGDELTAMATALGFERHKSKPILRRETDPASGATREIVPLLFESKVGDWVSSSVADGFVIARLTEIITVDPANSATAIDALADSLSAGYAGELFEQARGDFRTRFPVSISQRTIDSLL